MSKISKRKKLFVLVGFNILIVLASLLTAEGILWYLQRGEGWQVKGLLVPHPQLGYHLDPTREGVEAELGIKTYPFAKVKPEGTFRILLIGDSVSWQSGPDCFPNQLQEMVKERNVEIINAAIPGYTVYQEKLMLQRALPVQPDLILIQYCINDHHRFLHELSSNGMWLFTKEAKAAMAPTDNTFLAWLTRKSRLVRSVRMRILNRKITQLRWNEGFEVAPAWTSSGWELYEANFLEMLESADSIPTAVLAFPYTPQYQSKDADAFFPQEQLKKLCESEGVPFLDFTETFLTDQKTYFKDKFHLSSEGHKATSERLFHFLTEAGLLSFPPTDTP